MLYPMLEEKLLKARLAFDGATSESIIELCKKYLALLAEYRGEPASTRGTRRRKGVSQKIIH